AEQGQAVREHASHHLDHQHGGGEKERQPNSSGGAGARWGELHRPYLIAHWRIILTILYLPRQQDNDSTGPSFRIIFSVLSRIGSAPPLWRRPRSRAGSRPGSPTGSCSPTAAGFSSRPAAGRSIRIRPACIGAMAP